jgi:hypothetical protein
MTNNNCEDLKNLLREKKFKELGKEYLKFIHELECIVCYSNIDLQIKNELKNTLIAHHENLSFCFSGYKRITDFTAIPLCEFHHKNRHKEGFSIYKKWFGDEKYVFLWVFTILEIFFSRKNYVNINLVLHTLMKSMKHEKIDLLTLKQKFDSVLLGIKDGEQDTDI